MLKKNYYKIYQLILYSKITSINLKLKPIAIQPKVFSLEKSRRVKLGNSGRFFKNLAFVGLAFSCLKFNKGSLGKIKSIMFALWNTVSSYTFAF